MELFLVFSGFLVVFNVYVKLVEGDLNAVFLLPLEMVKAEGKKLGLDNEMIKRAVNVGFSGGEKKRLETLQMSVLKPSLAILDEADSGLDIDALRVVAEGVNALHNEENALLVITHYQRLLNYIVPDFHCDF